MEILFSWGLVKINSFLSRRFQQQPEELLPYGRDPRTDASTDRSFLEICFVFLQPIYAKETALAKTKNT